MYLRKKEFMLSGNKKTACLFIFLCAKKPHVKEKVMLVIINAITNNNLDLIF